MSLTQLVLAAALIATVLGGLVAAQHTLESRSAEARTRQTLTALRQALASYHGRYQQFPAGPASEALQALLADSQVAPLLAEVPLRRDAYGRLLVYDGYGRSLSYLGPDPARGGLADFVSAGPDGLLGDPFAETDFERHAAADNLYGSDQEMSSL